METTSLIALVEALHLDLKVHRVKKNVIEGTVREICIKDQQHIWSLKADTVTEVCMSHIIKECGWCGRKQSPNLDALGPP